MEKITQYIKEVIQESKNITWPTRNQTIMYTIAVLIISIFVAYYLGGLDQLANFGLEKFLEFKNNFQF